MKPLEDFKVSLYKTNNSVENVVILLINLLRSIISGEWKDKILAIRRYMEEGDKSGASLLKSELPSFTVTGTFKGGHAAKNLSEATGLVILDFDHPACLETLRSTCNADPHTVACFQSPRDGLKVIVHVEGSDGRHAETYKEVRAYYERLTGAEIDESGKDLSRTCLVSYDPRAYIATLYESFVLPEAVAPEDVPAPFSQAKEQAKTEKSIPSTSYAGQEKGFVSSYLFFNPIAEGKRHNIVRGLAFKAAKCHCDASAIYSELLPLICDETFSKNELKSTVDSAYQKVREESTDTATTPQAAGKSATPPVRHYICPRANENEEEAYQEGEEQRKKTPFFSDDLYDNLPSLLNECLEADLNERERDVRILACLITFSALLPRTFGRYNHKLYSPNLYAWVIAPPASGKSAAEPAFRLLDITAQVITRESDIALHKYEHDKRSWNAKCSAMIKKGHENELPDEPVEPPYRSLVIPSTTSNSRLIMQLRDNADLGGLIFDTEAKTLADNNKQDYGHLDSILCKAFSHEAISSSFFAHGKKPVECFHPQLSMFVSCTTTQVNSFVDDVDNGLLSRILIYTFRSLPKWKNMGMDEYNSDDHFELLSEKIYNLFCFCKEHPMMFNFTRLQWNELNRTFSTLLETSYLEDREELMATVKRYAFCTMRIAMILARLEQFDRLDSAYTGECPERFFRAALAITLCCYEHSRLLLTAFEHPHHEILKNPNILAFPLDKLPDTFTRNEALEVAVNEGMSQRTAERILKKLIGLKISKIDYGKYQKVAEGYI